jgi:hypothetical protein
MAGSGSGLDRQDRHFAERMGGVVLLFLAVCATSLKMSGAVASEVALRHNIELGTEEAAEVTGIADTHVQNDRKKGSPREMR